MKRPSTSLTLLLVLVSLAVSTAWTLSPLEAFQHARPIPVTYLPLDPSDIPALDHTISSTVVDSPSFPSLAQFVASVASPDQEIVGVYVPELMALRVVQQPAENSTFVSSVPDTVTQFQSAAGFGSFGFLAHNYLAGARFTSVKTGQKLAVVFGDATTREFQVSNIRHVQALSPNDPFSDFLDLDNGGVFSSSDLFLQVYSQKDTVVFQTCIAQGGNRAWGRHFVIAQAVAQN